MRFLSQAARAINAQGIHILIDSVRIELNCHN